MSTYPLKKLSELFEIERGGSPRPIEKFLTTNSDGINWIKIGDTKNVRKYIYQTEQKIIPEGVKRSRMVYEDDFILSNSMSFGRPYIMKTKGCIHDGWLVLRNKLKGQVDQDYLYYVLSSDYVFRQFDSLAAGSTVRNLNISLVKTVSIPLPPLSAQEEIVAKLDSTLASIDEAKTKTQQALAATCELWESTLEEAFRRDDSLDEQYLGDVIKIKHGFSFLSQDFQTSDDEKLPILLTPGNFSESGELYFTPKNTKRFLGEIPKDFLFDKGDLVVVMTDLSSQMKILGKPAIINANNILHNQRIGRIQFIKKDIIDKNYLYYYFLTQAYIQLIKETSTGTMVKHTAPSRITNNKIWTPPMHEQSRIIAHLDAVRAETDRLASLYEQKLADLDELRRSVLQEAFAQGA